MHMPPITIAGFSFHGLIEQRAMDVFGYLESCRYRYHLLAADIWCGLMGKDPEAYLQADAIERVREAIAERGMWLANYHADGCHVWEDDPAARERMAALAERHLAAAERLGARTVRIDTGGRDRHWTPQQFDAIVERFRGWASRAADGGYRIGPETHWGAENYPDNMLQLVRAVDSPAFGILLHMGKRTAGSPEDFDRLLAPHAMHTHIDAATTFERCAAALAILRSADYRGCLGVEHHSGRNEHAEVAAQLAVVRRAAIGAFGDAVVAGDSTNALLGH